jgi:hypothetical protein
MYGRLHTIDFSDPGSWPLLPYVQQRMDSPLLTYLLIEIISQRQIQPRTLRLVHKITAHRRIIQKSDRPILARDLIPRARGLDGLQRLLVRATSHLQILDARVRLAGLDELCEVAGQQLQAVQICGVAQWAGEVAEVPWAGGAVEVEVGGWIRGIAEGVAGCDGTAD